MNIMGGKKSSLLPFSTFFKLNFLRMILLKNTSVDECLTLAVSPFCTLLLITCQVGAEGRRRE